MHYEGILESADVLLASGRGGEAAALLEKEMDGIREETPTDTRRGREYARSYLEQIRHGLAGGLENPLQLVTSRKLNQQAEDLLENKRPEKAMIVIAALMQENPDDFRAVNSLGLLNYVVHMHDNAFDCFVRALSINPLCRDALTNAVYLAFVTHRLAEVLPCLAKARDLSADLWPTRFEAAKEESERSMRHVRFAELCLREEAEESAANHLIQALRCHPLNPSALHLFATLAHSNKQYAIASSTFDVAALLTSEPAQAHQAESKL
jgi:tetratricopeptide (TPR) repeat protein